MNKEVKVGLFVTIALALLYFGFNYLKGIDFLSSTNKFYAIYDNVDQLAVSNPVLVNGYAVGRVSNIRIVQGKENKVLVELEIDSDIIVGDSATAILNSDFLGSKSILLNIGNKLKPLNPGDTILAEAARGIFDVFTETAEPVANNVQTTLRKLNTVLDNLASNSARLDTLFMKLTYTPGLVNRALITTDDKMKELSASFKLTSDNLSIALRDLRPVIGNFKAFSDTLKQMELNKTVAKTQQTLDNLNRALSKLNNDDNTVSKLLKDDSLYLNLNRLLLNLDTLAIHFDNNPKHFLAPLGKSKKRIERDRRKSEGKN
ncbi:MAG: MlaD family protein [Cyclobacteriaceae bacterium]|nr:MCE family protein [Cyclobacteriaceae bacterium]MCB9237187.1 MCE family protein [Flammeovirgaceae bacterium]MCB0499995.1 MCE family protein [Cyclobacteriaceae bacterium]MCO5270896.1 MlaD family protein [Cyclobacteriaceae bacterium]MCW5901818.1 MCE family protein [Cyclobacteriaceae bacterium]